MNRLLIATLGMVSVAGGATAAPVLSTMSTTDLGGGLLGWTLGIQWNDLSTASGYFQLEFAADGIIQQQAFGVIDVNEVNVAGQFAAVDPNYDLLRDSYFIAGPGTPFAQGTPPTNGVDPLTGVPGSNVYRASFGTTPLTPVSGTTEILYLVTDATTTSVDVRGSVARQGEDYSIDQVLMPAGFPSGIVVQHGSAGEVRLGTVGPASALVTNFTADEVTGVFGLASGEFSGGGTSFSVGANESVSGGYTYAPIDHTEDVQIVSLDTSNGPLSITLSGRGVGPEYADNNPSNVLDVGILAPGAAASASMELSNESPDWFSLTLANLNITSLEIIDNNGLVNWSVDIGETTLYAADPSTTLTVTALANTPFDELATATLVVHTDQNAPLGGDGLDFHYSLVAHPVPEPTAGLLLAIGLSVCCCLRELAARSEQRV